MPDDKRDERKERVIHTRISESLDDEIRKRATNLGLSVSNLVRNVLLNTFGLVEDLMAESADMARSAGRGWDGDEREEPREPSSTSAKTESQPGTILGWQPMVLSLNAVCDRCNAVLNKGSQAAVAVWDGTGPRTIICARCSEEAVHVHGTSGSNE